jgi:hypothetical protein
MATEINFVKQELRESSARRKHLDLYKFIPLDQFDKDELIEIVHLAIEQMERMRINHHQSMDLLANIKGKH